VLRLPHGERSERGDTLGRPQRFLHQLAGSQSLFTRPQACASSAKMGVPQNELSLQRPVVAMTRGSVCVPPPPDIPSDTS